MEKDRALGYSAAACSTVLVGLAVAGMAWLNDYPVFGGQAVRYGLAGVLLVGAAAALRKPLPRPTWREAGYLVLLAATGLVGFNVFLAGSLHHAEPAVPGLTVGAVPVVVALLAPLLARRRPAPNRLVGAAVIVAGAAVVQGTGRSDGLGIALALATMACEVAFTLLAVPILPRLGAWAVSAWTCLLAAPALGLAGVLADGSHALPAPTSSQLTMILFLAVGSTMIGFVAWYSAVARIGADLAALVSGGVPVVTLAGGVLLGTGSLSGGGVVGGLIVTAGLLVGLRPSTRAPRRLWAWATSLATGRT